MPLKPGDRIERYVIDGHLGSGGMGEVYRAHDPRLKRAIALKILAADIAPPDPNAKTSAPVSNPGARMLREAQLAASLDHPNVVAIFDVGQLEEPPELRGTTYLAMELIRGESLRKYIGDASIKMKVRIRWLEEIARALGAAHAAGLVHRDVKPENVMIREDGIVKVLDFGIAKRTAAATIDVNSSTEGYAVPTMTQKGAVVGTPMYMAPEQLRAETLDGRTDQFAWGVVAYELLTGKSLWSLEGGGFSLVAQILQAPPPSTSTFVNVPERVAAVVVKALSKDPEARFPTMGALVAELTGRTEAGDTDGRIRVPGGSDMPAPRISAPSLHGDVIGGSATDESPSMRETRAAQLRTLASRPSAKPEGAGETPPRRAPRSMAIALGAAALVTIAAATMLSRGGRIAPVSDAAATTLVVSGACASNAECTRTEGAPAICRQRSCVRLESPDCHSSADPRALASDETIWIGGMYRLTGPDAAGDKESERGIDLARKDFAEMAGALGAQARPLGLVVCDEVADAPRAARHLAVDLGVPAIIGFTSGAELTDLATSVFKPNGVLAVASRTTSPLVTQLPRKPGEPPLVWRTTMSMYDVAKAIAALVDMRIEPQLRAESARRTRVALLRPKTAGALAFSERFFDVLRFNGKSALDNGPDYRELVFADGSPAEYASALARLRDFAPQIVVSMGGDGYVENVLQPFERTLSASKGLKPRYLDTSDFGGATLRMVGRDVDLRRRFYGVTLPSTTPVNARFTMHFNESYGTELSRADAPSTEYDAFYLLGYASFALGAERPTGESMARAMGHLIPPGPTVDVGPSGILQAYTRLSAGDSIDLNGTTGALDYDPATGERPIDLSVLCIDVDRTGTAIGSIESGAVFVGRSGQVTGRMTCP